MPGWKPDFLKTPEERAGEGKGEKVELPKELEDRFSSIKTDVTTEVKTLLDSKLKDLEDIVAFAKEAKEEKDKRNKKPEPNPDPNKGKTREEINAEFVARFAEDPLAALAETQSTTNNAILLTRADNVKREVFVDRAEEFPYYTGTIKKEIDEILEKQPLAFRNNAESVANVYYTVIGKKQKEIQEGTIKTRFASATPTTSSSKKEEDDKVKSGYKESDLEIQRAAKLLGMQPKDYLELVDKEAEVNV